MTFAIAAEFRGDVGSGFILPAIRGVVASSIEQRLCRLFGYEHAILFGRARAGLVAVLEEAAGLNRAVVFPSNVCVAVLAAVVAAKQAPRLAAVSPQSGLAEDDRLAEAIMTISQPGVVMPTHIYGQLAEYRRTRRLAAERGWFVLENDSLAATISAGRDYRAYGDALLVSFGSGKTIDAGGGGAILTNDKALASALTGARCNGRSLTRLTMLWRITWCSHDDTFMPWAARRFRKACSIWM